MTREPDVFQLCDSTNFLLRAGELARKHQAAVAIAHVGGRFPWLVFDANAYPSFSVVARVQPDGYTEVF